MFKSVREEDTLEELLRIQAQKMQNIGSIGLQALQELGGRNILDDTDVFEIGLSLFEEFRDSKFLVVYVYDADSNVVKDTVAQELENRIVKAQADPSKIKLLIVVKSSRPKEVQISVISDILKTYSLKVALVDYLVTNGYDDYLKRAKDWKKKQQDTSYCRLM